MSELRRARIDKGLSIDELAVAAAVSPDQIRNIENGRSRNPYASTLYKLASVLEVKPSVLDPILNERTAA